MDEWAALNMTGNNALSSSTLANVQQDLALIKEDQYTQLDPNQDGKILFGEFQGWIGLDPNLLFDRFDLDKSG